MYIRRFFVFKLIARILRAGKEDEELIWLENPSGDFKSGTWSTHVLTHGPGVYFQFTQMSTAAGTMNCIFTAEFFRKSLSVYWTTQSRGLFTDANQVLGKNIYNVFSGCLKHSMSVECVCIFVHYFMSELCYLHLYACQVFDFI